MLKSLEFLFWVAVLAVVVVGFVWFYGESDIFRGFVDTIWNNFISNFKNKVGM